MLLAITWLRTHQIVTQPVPGNLTLHTIIATFVLKIIKYMKRAILCSVVAVNIVLFSRVFSHTVVFGIVIQTFTN